MRILLPRALLAAIPLSLAADPPSATSSLDRFRYQPAKIRVGEVAHYVKSNLDGSKPSRVSVFVAAKDRLEVAKVEKDVTDAAWVRVRFDWKIFTADRLEAGVIRLDGSVEERAVLQADTSAGDLRVTLGDRTETTPWSHVPFHVYNFDFTSLNFAWRHLKDPKTPFEVDVLDPTFQREGPLFVDRGLARIEYRAEGSIRGKTCRRYRISGPGIGGNVGSIWEDPASGWLERIEIPFPDNPDWTSFRLEIQKIETMTPEAWKAFIRDSLAAANARG